MRLEYTIAMFAVANELLKGIKNETFPSDYSREAKNIHSVKVKIILEQLRSILDYAACDISEVLHELGKKKGFKVEPPGNIYFPYSLLEMDFKGRVNSSLKGIKEHFREIYEEIELIQPFKCNDNWLKELCELTNYNKHDQLSEPQKKHDGS